MKTLTLELTLEEHDLLVSALGIADQVLSRQRSKFISEVVAVRGGVGSKITSNPDSLEGIIHSSYLHLEDRYSDLRYKLYEAAKK